MAASESSCAHEKAVAKRGGEAESALEVSSPQRRSWVALASIPLLCSGDDATRAEEMAPGVADLILELHEPPRASYLALPERVAHDYKRGPEDGILPRILAEAPARLLISGVDYMYWCDVRAGTAYQLPAVPENLPVNMFPEPNIGLVADPSCPGEYMLVHLHPTPQASRMRHSALLCFSTAARGRQWFFKPLDSSPDHKPWHTHGVVAHDGMLCWVDVAYGILWCNPFDENPGLRLVPLPNGCTMPGTANRVYFSRLLDKRRCVRLSEGKLRYIQITATGLPHNLATMNDPPDNPTVSMWTLKALADMDAGDPWTPEYQVAFTDIWNHHKYIAAGLPRGKVPNLALVDPNNHYVIYFFHEKSLFAWDVIAAELVSCEENLVDFDYQNLELQYSRFVEAWDPASPDEILPEPSTQANDKLGETNEEVREVKKHIVYIRGPAPPNHLIEHQLHNEEAGILLHRTGIEAAVKNVQRKRREEMSKKAIKKLGREEKYLKDILKRSAMTEERGHGER